MGSASGEGGTDRADRLAAALRDNLRRRKAQARARAATPATTDDRPTTAPAARDAGEDGTGER